jgi:segregation and condensation protein A
MTHQQLTGQMQLLPLAKINGQPLHQLPEDLYIPPEALEIFLETFEGPLDLLLYLIRKDNIDILDIPIASITKQYIEYLKLMQALKLELAADYLVMAAMLAEIKSRLLLPKPPIQAGEEEQDPRTELIKRLQIYEQMKKAAEDLSHLPQHDKDFFWVGVDYNRQTHTPAALSVSQEDLLQAMQQVLARCALRKHHAIKFETISVRARMSAILTKLSTQQTVKFTHCFDFQEGRAGVVATFIALLELLKEGYIRITQDAPYATIFCEKVNPTESAQ